MDRHLKNNIRKAEDLSLTRTDGMNQEVSNYFTTLLQVMPDTDLFGQSNRIYNINKKCVQVNIKTGRVLTSEGAKCPNTITSTDKGGNIFLIACCNTESTFLPPILFLDEK